MSFARSVRNTTSAIGCFTSGRIRTRDGRVEGSVLIFVQITHYLIGWSQMLGCRVPKSKVFSFSTQVPSKRHGGVSSLEAGELAAVGVGELELFSGRGPVTLAGAARRLVSRRPRPRPPEYICLPCLCAKNSANSTLENCHVLILQAGSAGRYHSSYDPYPLPLSINWA